MLPIDDLVTHYTLARHTRNCAIVDIRNKTTNELQFIKIRHRLANFYAMSLVDPKTFDVWAETQVKSASTRLKPITLQGYKNSVLLKDTSIFGFEWSFEWENQKYKWVRESPIRPSLECKAIIRGRANDICVARYLPRGGEDDYFGLVTILDNALVQVNDERSMELLLITSLMTILDKANDNRWKKEKLTGALFLEPNEIPSIHHPDIYGGAKNRHEDIGGTDSDDDDEEDSGNISNDNHGKQHNRSVDLDGLEKASSNEQQQRQKTAVTSETLNEEVHPPQQQQSIYDDSGDGYASQQQQQQESPSGGGSSLTHDLRSHQRQQVEYFSHMLSTMKHSQNATVTLPPSFVQHTTIDTTTSTWKEDDIGGGRQSLQTLWHHNNYQNTNNKHQHRYNNIKEIMGQQMDSMPSSSMPFSSRRYNSQHHRTRSHRRLSSIDPPHWVPFIRQRLPPAQAPETAPSFRNSINLHHFIPGPHQQYYLP